MSTTLERTPGVILCSGDSRENCPRPCSLPDLRCCVMAHKFINLTSHDVVVGQTTFPPSGIEARCHVDEVEVYDFCGIPLVTQHFGDVADLPAYSSALRVSYIVSRVVAEACPERDDLYFPTKLVRNTDGKILRAGALGMITKMEG